jgi:hypothetical protein
MSNAQLKANSDGLSVGLGAVRANVSAFTD